MGAIVAVIVGLIQTIHVLKPNLGLGSVGQAVQKLGGLVEKLIPIAEQAGELTAEQAADIRKWQADETASPHWLTDAELGRG